MESKKWITNITEKTNVRFNEELKDDIEAGGKHAPEWIQILKTGEWDHYLYGKMKITSEHLQQMKKNFDDRIRGVDLAVDYSHDSGGVAAGWFEAIELEKDNTQLWARIKWTPSAKQKLEDQEFRYISADFDFDYKDAETRKGFKAVLLGCALTNRPFLKDMSPTTELSEKKKMEDELMEKQLEELKKDKVTLSEKISTLETEKKGLEKQLSDSKEEIEKEKRAKDFQKLLDERKAVPAQKDAYMKNDMNAFVKAATQVKLNEEEKGAGEEKKKEENKEEEIKEADLDKKVEEVKEEKKLSYAEALSYVLNEFPKYREYYDKKEA